MKKKHKTFVVLVEETDGPIEIKVRICDFGSLHWGVGRHLPTGTPRVCLSTEFGKRLCEAVKLLEERVVE